MPFIWQFLEAFSVKVVQQFIEIYGAKECTFNVHSFTHLFDYVSEFGEPERYSSFAFESYLGKLKKMVAAWYKPGAQVYRRVSEKCSKELMQESFDPLSQKRKHQRGECVKHCGVYYSATTPDNAVIVKGKPAVIDSIVGNSISYYGYIQVQNL